jgi:hypothetical protein
MRRDSGNIQGTCGVIQGTCGVIQGTCGVIQGTFREDIGAAAGVVD